MRPEQRYKFLLLNGPSRFGKTAFARHQFGKHRTYLADCSNGKPPDLRAFDPLVHRCIIFDEMPLPSVMEWKRVIQAPCTELSIGNSPTQMLTVTKWFGRCAMVVTTNKLYDEWAKLDASDRDWITKNSFVHEVADYLYCRSAEEEEAAKQQDTGWEECLRQFSEASAPACGKTTPPFNPKC